MASDERLAQFPYDALNQNIAFVGHCPRSKSFTKSQYTAAYPPFNPDLDRL